MTQSAKPKKTFDGLTEINDLCSEVLKVAKSTHGLSFDSHSKFISAQKDFSNYCTPYLLRRTSDSNISQGKIGMVLKFPWELWNYLDISQFRNFIRHRCLEK